MATTTGELRTFAQALHDTLLSNAVEQLRVAASKLDGVNGKSADITQKIDAALPQGALPQVRNFLMLLASEGLLDQLGPITQAFEGYATSRGTAVDAEVTSAVALDEAQRAKIARELRERYGKELELQFSIDPSLIGGLIIRVGDQVLDNSLRTRLNAVQRSMQLG